MKTRKLGALEVSEIGYGTMSGAEALERAHPGDPQAGAGRGKSRRRQRHAQPR